MKSEPSNTVHGKSIIRVIHKHCQSLLVQKVDTNVKKRTIGAHDFSRHIKFGHVATERELKSVVATALNDLGEKFITILARKPQEFNSCFGPVVLKFCRMHKKVVATFGEFSHFISIGYLPVGGTGYIKAAVAQVPRTANGAKNEDGTPKHKAVKGCPYIIGGYEGFRLLNGKDRRMLAHFRRGLPIILTFDGSSVSNYTIRRKMDDRLKIKDVRPYINLKDNSTIMGSGHLVISPHSALGEKENGFVDLALLERILITASSMHKTAKIYLSIDGVNPEHLEGIRDLCNKFTRLRLVTANTGQTYTALTEDMPRYQAVKDMLDERQRALDKVKLKDRIREAIRRKKKPVGAEKVQTTLTNILTKSLAKIRLQKEMYDKPTDERTVERRVAELLSFGVRGRPRIA